MLSHTPAVRRLQLIALLVLFALVLVAGLLVAVLLYADTAHGQGLPDIAGPQDFTAARSLTADPGRPPADYRPLVLFIVAAFAVGIGWDVRRRLR